MHSYCSLRNIWKSNVYILKTKVRLFNRQQLHISTTIWMPNKISNADLYRRTNSLPINCQIQKHKIRCMGHVLRMSPYHIPMVALRWTPMGKGLNRRPKTTCRRSIITQLSDMGLTMGKVEVIVEDRKRWRNDIVALCHTWG